MNEKVYARHEYGKPSNQGASCCRSTCGGYTNCIYLYFGHHRGGIAFWFSEATRRKTTAPCSTRIPATRDVLPWDNSVAEDYGVARAAMERQGKVHAPIDLLIATHALSIGAVLVTNDQAFSQMAELHLEDWTD